MAGNNRLTWKDVSAPNFSAAGEMAKNASNMIQQAIGGVGAGLEGFDDFQKQQAANYLARQTSQFTNPEELQAALASGSLFGGADPTKFSAGDLSKVNSRVSSLLDQENTRINTLNNRQLGERNQTIFNESQEDKQWANDNSEAINAYRVAAGAGNIRGELNSLMSIPGMNQKRFNEITGSALNYARDSNNLATELHNSDQKFLADGRANDDYLANQKAERIYNSAVDKGILNSLDNTGIDAAKQLLSSVSNPLVANALRGRLSKAFPGGFDPININMGGSPDNKFSVISAPGTAGTIKGSSYDTILGYGKHGNTNKPITQMTLGEWDDFGKNTLIPATRNSAEYGLQNTGKGSSAMGFYQFTGETLNELGKEVLGDNWKNTVMTPEVQDKLGKALFEKRKGTNLTKTWAGLPDLGVGGYANKSWDEMKSLINKYESKTDGTSNKVDTALTQTIKSPNADERKILSQQLDIGANTAKVADNQWSSAFVASRNRHDAGQKDGSNTTLKVADNLTKLFPSYSSGEIAKYIDDILTDKDLAGLTPEDASEILQRSASSRSKSWTGFGERETSIDTSKLKKNIESIKKIGVQNILQDGQTAKAARENVVTDSKAYIDAINALETDRTKILNSNVPTDVKNQMLSRIDQRRLALDAGTNQSLGNTQNVFKASGVPVGNASAAIAQAVQPPTPIETKVATPPASFTPAAKYGESKPAVKAKPSDASKAKAQEQIAALEQEITQIEASTALGEGVKMMQAQAKRNAIKRLKADYEI